MPKSRLIALKIVLAITTVLLFLNWVSAPEMHDLELPNFNLKGCPYSTTDSTLVFRKQQYYSARSIIAATDVQNGSTRYTRLLDCTPNQAGEYVTKTGTQILLHSIDGMVILQRSIPSGFEPDELYGHMLVCHSKKGLSFVDLDANDSEPYTEPYTESKSISVVPRWNRSVISLGSGRFLQTSYQNDVGINFVIDVTNRKTTEFADRCFIQITHDGMLVLDGDSITLHSQSNGEELQKLSLPSNATLMPTVDHVYFGWDSSTRNICGVNHFEGKPIDTIRVAEDTGTKIQRRLFNVKTNTYLQTNSDVRRLHDVDQMTGRVLLETMDDQMEVVDPQTSTVVSLPWNRKMVFASFVGQDRIAILSNDLLWQHNIAVYDLKGQLTRTIRPLLFWRLSSLLLVAVAIFSLSMALRTISRWHGFAWVDVLGMVALFFFAFGCRNYWLQGTLLDWPHVLGAACSIAVLFAFLVVFGKNRFSIKFLAVQIFSMAIVLFLVDTQLGVFRRASSGAAMPFVVFWLSLVLFIVMRVIGFTSRFRVGEVIHVAAGRFQIVDLLLIMTATALVFFSIRHGSFSWRQSLTEILSDRTALGAVLAGGMALVTGLTSWPAWVRIALGILGLSGALCCMPRFGNSNWDMQQIPLTILTYGTISILTHLIFYAYRCRGCELGFQLGYRQKTDRSWSLQ